MKFDVTEIVVYSALRFLDFDSPEPNDKCEVNDSNWPGVRVVKHGDDVKKSDSSKSLNRKNIIRC